jgi:hypothetical protein
MDHFPASYAESREWFLQNIERLRSKWPLSQPGQHKLSNHPNLSIDWLWAEPHKKEHLVIVSTAEHGIEGYVGTAMLKIFIEEFAPQLDPENTGLLLIHTINPWGMQHNSKVNENGVDLNRNFVFDENFDMKINPEFRQISYLITPHRPVRTVLFENLSFWGRVLRALLSSGQATVSKAALLGQHHTPTGFFYGGTKFEESTQVLIHLYRRSLEEYQSVIQTDIHTGYGPRYQMSVIIPPVAPISSAQARQKFNYPLVQRIDPQEFYAINGDMGEYIYRLRDAQFPNRQLFSCGFEFGTYGDSLLARLRSLKAMTLENQLRWHGALSESAGEAVRHEFGELYFPADPRWREKALADGRQAFKGILSAFHLIDR